MVQNIYPFLFNDITGLAFNEKLRLGIQRLESIKALKRANRIIVTSNFIKDFLTKKLAIPVEKVSLVYFGRDSLVRGVTKPVGLISGLEKNFLFTAGSLESYRGTEDVIGAARYLKNDLPGLKIVIAGEARDGAVKYHKKFLELVKLYDLNRDVIWAGQLSQNELAWCYQNCTVFISTSRMETFGMVNLEAMSNGCLCIAAQNPPLPEIFGDSAYYYSPKDSRSLANAIKNVLSWNNEKKLEMADKAKKRAEYFSWDKAADGLIKECQTAIKS
ncbi:MAG: glycosyltransferase family 1 protein [Candidatus Omnitrophota bacterium]